MPRPLLLSLLVVASALAAPVPKKVAKDYQKLADETEWQFSDKDDFANRLDTELKGYEVDVIDQKAGVMVRILNAENEKLFGWETHLLASFVQRYGVLYYTDFSPYSCGCSVVAFELNAKKQLWKTDLKGIGQVPHSKYHNEVRMEVLDDDTVAVFGKESAGRYVEIVHRGSGKTVGHKVFDEKK